MENFELSDIITRLDNQIKQSHNAFPVQCKEKNIYEFIFYNRKKARGFFYESFCQMLSYQEPSDSFLKSDFRELYENSEADLIEVIKCKVLLEYTSNLFDE